MSDLSDDIVQPSLPRHFDPPPARTDFKPWHRVRKQYIREKQWNHHIKFTVQKLRAELRPKQGALAQDQAHDDVPTSVHLDRPLRLLMLPGNDYLDVRSLWRELENEQCYIRFLGFDSSIDASVRGRAVAESAVVQLSRILKDSHVLPDQFQNIGNKNSQAYSIFKHFGPYDVVNLDLCDSLIPREETKSYYEALVCLIALQTERQTSPWLLFITTSVDRRYIGQSQTNLLARPMRENCDEHAEFASILASVVPESSFKGESHTFDVSELDTAQLSACFSVILGKWLLKLLDTATPKHTVSMLSSYSYTVSPDPHVEMLSMGFRFEPVRAAPIDPTGLVVTPTAAPRQRSEEELGMQILKATTLIKSVDDILRGDESLREALTESSADLLASCGYDRSRYLAWVREEA